MIIRRPLTNQQIKRKELFQRAQEGDQRLLKFFLKRHNLKIYTNEEIKVVNLLRQKGSTVTMDIRDQEKVIELPSFNGNSSNPARINWLQDLGDHYFEAGLTYVGTGSPYEGGSTTWVLKLDLVEGFKPLFCSLYWNSKEFQNRR